MAQQASTPSAPPLGADVTDLMPAVGEDVTDLMTGATGAGVPPPRRTSYMPSWLEDVFGGLRASAAQLVYGGGDLLRRATGMERIIDEPDVQAAMTPPESLAGRAGSFAGEVAQFAVPATRITKAAKGLQLVERLVRAGVSPARARLAAAAVEAVPQAGAAAGVTALRGEEGAGTAAALGAAAPLAGAWLPSFGAALRDRARRQMTDVLRKGVQQGERLVTTRMERILEQAAGDALALPLQRTWRQWQQTTGRVRQRAGQTLRTALDGEFGREQLPKAPILEALDGLFEESAQHLVKAGGGAYRTATYDPPLVHAVKELRAVLDQYGDHIPVRQLHDLKAIWDKAVFPRREGAQPIASIAEQLTTAQKEARRVGADAIRQLFRDEAPTLAALDEATSHAIQLDQLVKKLAQRVPGLPRGLSETLHAVGGGAGAVAGGTFIRAGYVGHILGAHLGSAAVRVLTKAIESPLWYTLSPTIKDRLARAIAAGRGDQVRTLLAPIVAAGATSESTRSAPPASGPPATPAGVP